jgi:hypothetical protein
MAYMNMANPAHPARLAFQAFLDSPYVGKDPSQSVRHRDLLAAFKKWRYAQGDTEYYSGRALTAVLTPLGYVTTRIKGETRVPGIFLDLDGHPGAPPLR